MGFLNFRLKTFGRNHVQYTEGQNCFPSKEGNKSRIEPLKSSLNKSVTNMGPNSNLAQSIIISLHLDFLVHLQRIIKARCGRANKLHPEVVPPSWLETVNVDGNHGDDCASEKAR